MLCSEMELYNLPFMFYFICTVAYSDTFLLHCLTLNQHLMVKGGSYHSVYNTVLGKQHESHLSVNIKADTIAIKLSCLIATL
jgi:hypothetical protein